jgi:hypothetical protein
LRGRPRSTVPWALAGTIGLILVIEGFVARNWLDFSDPASLSWRYSAQAAKTQARGREILCLGDSLVKHGLVPSVIEGTSARQLVNLAAARAPALWTYFVFRRALAAGAQPAAIVVNAKPAVLIGGLDYDARYWQEVLTLGECIELFRMTGKGSFLVSTLVGRLLPSLRSRLEIRSNLLAALRGENDRLYAINRVLWRNWSKNGGANVAAADSRYNGEVSSEVARRLHTDVFYVDRSNAQGIERLLQLAHERRVPVFWLLPPLSPALQALRDQSRAEARYEEFIRSFQARYPDVMTVLDARRLAYPPSLFVDATHLNARGAIALSRSVTKALEAEITRSPRFPSPRWVALGPPPAAPDELDFPLEDIEQTKGILNLVTKPE